MPVTSEARVRTEKADRYANRLSKHFGHKIRAGWMPPEGLLEFPELGTCRLASSPTELILKAEAPDAERLAGLEEVVGSHLRRFGTRDGLKVAWDTEEVRRDLSA